MGHQLADYATHLLSVRFRSLPASPLYQPATQPA